MCSQRSKFSVGCTSRQKKKEPEIKTQIAISSSLNNVNLGALNMLGVKSSTRPGINMNISCQCLIHLHFSATSAGYINHIDSRAH